MKQHPPLRLNKFSNLASMVIVSKLETSNLKTLEPPIDLNLLQSKSMSTLILILKES
jgi:hypothetical protein